MTEPKSIYHDNEANQDRAELLNLPKLTKDDSFLFNCKRCGKCCRNREDILLTPLDLFKIAKHQQTTISDILEKYCDGYAGKVSKIPIVRIKPREYQHTCPFMAKWGCRIHSVKPAVCALYPLGRIMTLEKKELTYILQPTTCGKKNKTQTVQEWLFEFSILEEEDISILWHKTIGELSTILQEVYEKPDLNHDRLNEVMFLSLYISYDLEKDFMPQFKRNCKNVLDIAKDLKKMANEQNNKREDK